VTLHPSAKLSGRRSAMMPFILAFLLIGLGGCKEERPAAEESTPVRAQLIAIEASAEARAYTGVVHARYETDLGFRVAGKIVERLVNIGDPVMKDQVLARLDPTDYRLALESSEAELVAARSSLAQAAAEQQRFEKLLTDRWVSPAAYDQKKAAADEARGRVERAERALSVARNQVAYTELRANEAGVITALPVKKDLPEGVIGPVFNDEYGDVFSAVYMISGDGLSLAELKDYAETVRQRLRIQYLRASMQQSRDADQLN